MQPFGSGGNSRYVDFNSLLPISLRVSLNWRVPVAFLFCFWNPGLVPRVPEKYTVTSAPSSAYAGKVDYNRVSPGSLRRSLAAPLIFLPCYHSALRTMHFHLNLGRPHPTCQSPSWDPARVLQLGIPLGEMD